MLNLIDATNAFNFAMIAADKYRTRSPLVEVVSRQGKTLYCGWSMARAERLLATHKTATASLHTFDVDGRALLQMPITR